MPNPKMPGGSFNACVAIMQERGNNLESAKKICGKLKRVSDEDSIFKEMQPIATEGVLPYREGDKIVYKLKKWDNLKKYDGIEMPIVNEHPENLVSEDNTIPLEGYAKVIGDEKTKTLYADLSAVNDMPKKKGYSIGYIYNQIDEQGEWEGKHYDSVQQITKIDHLALTDYNRSPIAVATDSNNKKITENNNSENNTQKEVLNNIKEFDFFNYKIIKKIVKTKKVENNMIEKDEPAPNPNAKEIDSLKELAKVKTELASLKAKKEANDSYAKKLQELEKELDSVKAERDSAKEILKKQKAEELKNAMDSLVKLGVDAKEFDGKSPDYLQGRIDQADFDSKKHPSTATIDDVDGNDALEDPKSYFDIKYNADSKRWE